MDYRHSLFLTILFYSLSAGASERFKGVDLWLPTAYQKQYSKLLDAAEKAKSDPYCFQLLTGRVLESQSTTDHMQFYFRCRTEDRTTFSIQVDGNTLAATNAYGEKQIEAEKARLAEEEEKKQAEEVEANLILQKEDEEAARLLKEKVAVRRREQSRYWGICRKEMRNRLKTFDSVSILTESLPEPTIEADQFTYIVLFDSLSPTRKALHFQIICSISALDYYTVDIKPRKTTNKE